MKSRIYISFIIIFALSLNSFDLSNNESTKKNERDSVFNVLKSITDLQNNQKLLVLFANIGSCSKCVHQSYYLLNCCDSNFMINQQIKLLALVNCFRKNELNLFKRNYNWKDYVGIQKEDYKDKLSLPYNTQFALFNSDGKIIYYLTYNDLLNPTSACDSLKRAIQNFK